ncbi:hypothetical protein EIP86_007236 [Pleurotus ostreatoroseus]|nr:hypothetical protein EIP86_007236 [Pleurotus ostreatoroseus]
MLFNQAPHEQYVRAESSSTIQNSKQQDPTFRPFVISEIMGNVRNNGVDDALKQLKLAEHSEEEEGEEDEDDEDEDEDDEDEEEDEDDECPGGMGFELHPANRFRLSGSCLGLGKPGVVSHNWLAENFRHFISTPINNFAWPAPIPIDTTLDRIRIELLNHGTDIVWLDILCLRQEGSPELEALRVEEWKTDVPTIGSMYLLNVKEGNFASLTTYYNGLGRPFHIDDVPLEDKRCYLNRAWTLQEFNGYGTIGGLAPYSPLLSSMQEADMAFAKDPHLKRFYMHIQRVSDQLSRIEDGCNIFFILAALVSRNVTHATDGVGAIASLLTERHTPIYIRHDGPPAVEEAWVLLTQAMPPHRAAELFFMFPAAGDGAYAWCPSWQQAIQHSLPLSAEVISRAEVHCVQRGLASRFQFMGPMLTGVLVQGLTEPDPRGQSRSGMLVIDVEGITHSVKATVSHQLPIPENRYTLLGNVGSVKAYQSHIAHGHKLLKGANMPPMAFVGRVTKVGCMQKTATVTVTRWVVHKKTGKRLERSKKFLTHDEHEKLRLDDTVLIRNCPPISARKRFTLEQIIKSPSTERDLMHERMRARALQGETHSEAQADLSIPPEVPPTMAQA